MLQAMNQEGKLITLALLQKEQLEQQRNHHLFSCPQCNEKLIVKAGSRIIPHFAHQPKSICPSSKGGEGEYHEKGKLDLYLWLKKQQIQVQLECFVPEINQRPDLLVTVGVKQIAFEYQCARISYQEFYNRTLGYYSIGITPIWILGGNRLKRVGKDTLSISSYEAIFIHKFSDTFPLTLYFYDSKTKMICLFNHIQATGKKKSYGYLSFKKLSQFKFIDLWSYSTSKSPKVLENWKKDKIRFRTNPPSHISEKEKQWLQWIYLKQLYPSFLPSIIHLPVPGQIIMKCHPWIWQSKIVLGFFDQSNKFRLEEVKHLLKDEINPHPITPLIRSSLDPIVEYLTLLTSLQYLKKISNSGYQVVRPFEYFDNIEKAMKEDCNIMDQIKNIE